MIQFDINAGTHFDGKEIGVSRHAADEAMADFRIPEPESREWIREQLRKAHFIGEIYGENGVKVRLYGYQRIAFIVALESDVVITIYPRHKVDQILRVPIEKIVRDAVATSEARVKYAEESAAGAISRLSKGRFRAEERLSAAESDIARKEINAWIADMDNMLADEAKDIEAARMDHARLLKGVVAYV